MDFITFFNEVKYRQRNDYNEVINTIGLDLEVFDKNIFTMTLYRF